MDHSPCPAPLRRVHSATHNALQRSDVISEYHPAGTGHRCPGSLPSPLNRLLQSDQPCIHKRGQMLGHHGVTAAGELLQPSKLRLLGLHQHSQNLQTRCRLQNRLKPLHDAHCLRHRAPSKIHAAKPCCRRRPNQTPRPPKPERHGAGRESRRYQSSQHKVPQ